MKIVIPADTLCQVAQLFSPGYDRGGKGNGNGDLQ